MTLIPALGASEQKRSRQEQCDAPLLPWKHKHWALNRSQFFCPTFMISEKLFCPNINVLEKVDPDPLGLLWGHGLVSH